MEAKTTEVKVENLVIASPLHGDVLPLETIKDAAFASGALGNGVAIEPTEGKLFAPFSGNVSALFPTNHAVGLTTDDGAEILIHIGMDTVKLNGRHFTSRVAQGDRVEKGQVLIEFDIEAIKAEGFAVTTPVVVTNQLPYQLVTTKQTQLQAGDTLMQA